MNKKFIVAGFFLGVVASAISLVVLVVLISSGTATSTAANQTLNGDIPTPGETSLNVYYPGTEELDPDEMRVVACGTGQPSARPKQAASCWLVELGNGEKFLFDIGSGSHERIAAQMIPYDYLDKVFIGHLHVDHYGDLASFWLGGTTMNRLTPLRVWGPSGQKPEFGTKYALERLKEAYVWDIATRSGVIDSRGMELEINEFDYRGVNNIIYNENGVVIKSIPAIHGIDGAVSFILEWQGLKLAYSSDTFPNKWWTEHAKGADIAIHECFLPPTLLVEKQGFTVQEALVVGTLGHTSPQQFGKVMSETKPRLAVGYHFYNDFNTQPIVSEEVRKTYDGPLALATDYMVFNVAPDDIKIRMSAVNEEVWPSPAIKKKEAPQGNMSPPSDFINSGRKNYLLTLRKVWSDVNKKFGTAYKPVVVALQLKMGMEKDGDETPADKESQ